MKVHDICNVYDMLVYLLEIINKVVSGWPKIDGHVVYVTFLHV